MVARREKRQLSPFANRVVLKWYDELPFVDILKDAAKLPPHSAILWHLMNVMQQASLTKRTVVNALASVASAPIFSYDGSFFDGALVGGPMFSVMESSAATANVANRILSGERAGDIKTRSIEFARSNVRLATNAAVGDQREQSAARQHRLLPRANGVGAVFVADRARSPPFF